MKRHMWPSSLRLGSPLWSLIAAGIFAKHHNSFKLPYFPIEIHMAMWWFLYPHAVLSSQWLTQAMLRKQEGPPRFGVTSAGDILASTSLLYRTIPQPLLPSFKGGQRAIPRANKEKKKSSRLESTGGWLGLRQEREGSLCVLSCRVKGHETQVTSVQSPWRSHWKNMPPLTCTVLESGSAQSWGLGGEELQMAGGPPRPCWHLEAAAKKQERNLVTSCPHYVTQLLLDHGAH